VDQLGNILTSEVLNVSLLKKRARDFKELTAEDEIENTQFTDWPGMEFGEVDDSISYVIGVNYYSNNLTGLGKFLAKILNKLEKYHLERALLKKYLSDLDGALRLQKDFYYKIIILKKHQDKELVKLVYEMLGEEADKYSEAEARTLRKLDNLIPRGTPKPPIKRKG